MKNASAACVQRFVGRLQRVTKVVFLSGRCAYLERSRINNDIAVPTRAIHGPRNFTFWSEARRPIARRDHN
jgi:hypothetical protein